MNPPPTASGGWKIARDLEWGQWKFAGGAGALDASSAVGAVNALGQLSFSDVAVGIKLEDDEAVLRAPRLDLPVGTAVRVRLRARDVMIAVRPPGGISALNVLPGRVVP